MSPTVLVLGGYGSAGSQIVELLVRATGVHVVIAGRRFGAAKSLADRLNRSAGALRCSAVFADASDSALLEKALAEVDLVVVASSTSACIEQVAQAALRTETDYLDIQYSGSKVRYLESLRPEVEQAGRCFVTDGGFHPGIPAVLIRFAAGFIDRPQRVHVTGLARLDWRRVRIGEETATEFAAELLGMQLRRFRRGDWVPPRWWEIRRCDFGAPFGRRVTAPLVLEELKPLPARYPTLVDLDFSMAGFNWFVDYVVSPVGWLALRFRGARAAPAVGRWLGRGLRWFSRPPYGSVMAITAEGWKKGRVVAVRGRVGHEDGYVLTAIAVVATVQQYLDGEVRKPGLFYQGLAVEPRRFLADMERLGARVEYQVDVET